MARKKRDIQADQSSLSTPSRYVLVLGVVLATVVLRWELIPVIGTGTIYITLFPAMTVLAAFFGMGPGLFGNAIGIVLVEYFLVEPTGHIQLTLSLALRSFFMLVSTFYVGRVADKLRVARQLAEDKAAAAGAAEEALRHSEERFSRTFANNPAAIALTRLEDGVVLEVNDTWLALWGCEREEVIGRSARWMWPSAADTQRFLQELKGKGSLYGWEQAFRRKSGELIVTQLSAQVLTLGSEPIILSTLMDIGERKRAEEALKESRDQFNVLIQNVHTGVALVDEHGSFSIVNSEFLRIFDLSADSEIKNVNSRDWSQWQVFDENNSLLDVDEHPVRKAAITGKPVRDKLVRVTAPSGRDGKWLLISAEPLHKPDGRVDVFICTYYDITERVQAQEALRESEQRSRLVLENMSEGLMLFDAEGNIVYQNPASLRIHGIAESEGLLRRDDLPAAWRGWDLLGRQLSFEEWPISRVLRNEQFQNQTLRAERVETGLTFYASYNGCPIRDERGRLILGFITIRDITTEQLALEARQQSEDRFRVAQELSPDGFTILRPIRDGEGRVVDFTWIYENQTIARWNGTDPEEVVGRRLLDVIPSHAQAPFHRVYQEVAESGQPTVLEAPFQGEGMAEEKWFRVAVVPTGSDLAILSQDTTYAKKAEESLREREAQFRALADSIPNLAWWANGDGYITWYNQRWYDYTGTTPEQMEGWGWQSVHDPEALPQVLERWKESLATGNPFDMTFPLRGADGVFRPFLTRVIPVYGEDGRVTRWFGTNTDITDRQQAELKLKELAHQRQVALDAARLGWWHYDPVTRMACWDERYKEIFGVPVDQLPNDEILSRIIHPEDLPALWAKVEKALDPADSQRFAAEYRINRPDGAMRWIEAYGTALFETRGEKRLATSFVGTVADITERKHAEELVKASLAEKEVLLKEIHHRVKNNLQVISSLVGLQAGCSKDETIRQVLDEVSHRVRSMALVHEKLYQSADLAHIDFADYLRSLLSYIWRAHGAVAAAVRLSLDLVPTALPVDTAVPLGLIMNELAGNALKHAFPGRPNGEVTVSLKHDADGTVRLGVADNGTGLPEGLDWRTTNSLGLRLVQMLAGQLKAGVEVSCDSGASFQISIKSSRVSGVGGADGQIGRSTG